MPGYLYGGKHRNAKLTDDQARAIRASTESPSLLARRYNVSKATIYQIRQGYSWRHLEADDRQRHLTPFAAPGLPENTLGVLLLNGMIAVIDAADADRAAGHTWYWQPGGKPEGGYVCCLEKTEDGDSHQIGLHRLLLDAPPDLEVIFLDGDPLNHRQSNLALIDVSTRSQRAKLPRHNTSGYKGVFLDRRREKRGRNPWCAGIIKDGRKHYLGYYQTAEEAARAYNRAARDLFGELAFQNPITES